MSANIKSPWTESVNEMGHLHPERSFSLIIGYYFMIILQFTSILLVSININLNTTQLYTL